MGCGYVLREGSGSAHGVSFSGGHAAPDSETVLCDHPEEEAFEKNRTYGPGTIPTAVRLGTGGDVGIGAGVPVGVEEVGVGVTAVPLLPYLALLGCPRQYGE